MSSTSWNADIPTDSRKFAITGLLLLLIFGVGGGYWAYTAPLESAVVTSGSFVATGANKVVQHLEGGIVEKILVKEGDNIKAGDILIRLDRTKADGEHERLKKRFVQLLAYEARLKWETSLKDSGKIRDSDRSFPLPTTEKWPKGSVAHNIYLAQIREMQAGINNRQNQVRRLKKQKKAEKRKLAGIITVHKSLRKRLAEMDRQLQEKRRLLSRGLTTRDRLDSLILTRTQEQAGLDDNLSQQDQSKERILEIEQGIESVDLTNREEKIKELRTTRNELSDVQERLLQARNVAERVFIRAPVDGIIVQLSLNTEGGVISPGQQIMEILPTGSKLQIQVYVTPTDRDDISLHQKASVQLSALDQRTTPMLEGKVTYISADLIKRNNEDLGTYITRIDLSEKDQKIATNLKAVPGMPASVFIKTGSQTFWEYLTKPIRESMRYGINEK